MVDWQALPRRRRCWQQQRSDCGIDSNLAEATSSASTARGGQDAEALMSYGWDNCPSAAEGALSSAVSFSLPLPLSLSRCHRTFMDKKLSVSLRALPAWRIRNITELCSLSLLSSSSRALSCFAFNSKLSYTTRTEAERNILNGFRIILGISWDMESKLKKTNINKSLSSRVSTESLF